MGLIRDDQARRLPTGTAAQIEQPARGEHLHLLQEHFRIDDTARSDDAELVFVQHPRRHEVQDGGDAVHHDGVAGVVAAVKAHDHIGLLRQPVHDAPLAFIAPLRPDTYGIAHVVDSALGWILARCAV